MRLRFLTVFLFLICYQSQALCQEIVKKNFRYIYQDRSYKAFELQDIMSNDQQALHEYERYLDKRSDAKLAATIGNLIMGVGALYLFTGLANQCGNGPCYDKARIGILLVGIGLVTDLVALGIKINAKRNLKKSISIFNNGSQLGYQESIKLNFGTTSEGVGLTLSF